MANTRILRVNSEIQKAISEVLTFELHDPKITGIITVTKVDTTPDLEASKVFVSIMSENKQEVFNQIQHSASFIRREVCKKIILRKMPFLQFHLDKSTDITNSIEEKIAEINKSRKGE